MNCCAPGMEFVAEAGALTPDELHHAARDLGNGMAQVDLSVPAVHCGACIHTVEQALAGLEDVASARVNLSTRRVSIRFTQGARPPLVETLNALGYPPHLFDDAALGRDRTLRELLVGMAVAGFATANIMLLSVSIWSGADGATRDLFHWLSALIALPALLFAGRVFYRSAWRALRHGRMNMDVPIAIGVSLAYAMSLYETINHGPHAYFDASASLLFFLLIGRTLDHMMRDRARSAVLGLARLAPRGAVVLGTDGSREYRQVSEIMPGNRLLVAAGERIPVDALVESGVSDLDCSLVNGESAPLAVAAGSDVRAGTLNLTGPLVLEAQARAEDSFLAEMMRMMEAAEGGRGRYRRLADRVSSLYAPVVHLTALLTFIGWVMVAGDWRQAMTIGIAVLIITCPCALGLAVPAVITAASGRLFGRGMLIKDGTALERLAEVDCVVFDKTGTLTMGVPQLVSADAIPEEARPLALALAQGSDHPLSQALSQALLAQGVRPAVLQDLREVPGHGIAGSFQGRELRLGRADWLGAEHGAALLSASWLSLGRGAPIRLEFSDRLRPGAADCVRRIMGSGRRVLLLSGDAAPVVADLAGRLGIGEWRAGVTPLEKAETLRQLRDSGHHALMVGDGLNDTAALAEAHVSISPASALDAARTASDIVLMGSDLAPVAEALGVARSARARIKENFAISLLYNVVAVPFAIAGLATPLMAALAMSLSSISVTLNALRLRQRG